MKKLLIVITLSFITVSCATTKQTRQQNKLNKTQKGAIAGVGAGGVIGGIIGSKSNNTALGAILGATIGGAAGTVIGNQMDKQAKKLEDELGKAAKVERVGEGINVTFDNNLLFAFGKSYLNEGNKTDLKKFAGTLNEYPDTDLLIVGHTDSKGSDRFNQSLSLDRSAAVKTYLSNIGVSNNRLNAIGKGESEPVASNNTEYYRSLNRRVEITITANDKMKNEAKKVAGN